MRRVFIILSLIFLVQNLFAVDYCNSSYSCFDDNNDSEDFGSTPTSLTCSLPSLPNLTVKADNVFNSDGTLKTYWEAQNTVCDVVGWMDLAASSFDKVKNMDVTLSNSEVINLVISQDRENRMRKAASYKASTLTLDTEDLSDIGAYVDIDGNKCVQDANGNYVDSGGYKCDVKTEGNFFSDIMHFQTVHEMFHYAQEKARPPLEGNWVTEGSARMFEDIVYENENTYSYRDSNGIKKYQPMFDAPYIADILSESIISAGI